MAGTVIGGLIVVDGEISGDDDIAVHGTVKGRVACGGSVRIEPSGAVEADVRASHVEIAGSVEGDVVAADKVEIWPGGRAVGDIKAPRILISDGAVFKGNVDTDA
jgi:cytoskeletal protein CcmA (bactofilin family)